MKSNRESIFNYILVCLIVAGTLSCGSAQKTQSPDSYKGLGRDTVDEKTLASFAAPSLATEHSRKIQTYLDIRAPGMGMLSANKQQLFFTWKVTGTSQVWRLDQPKGFPVQMTGGEDSTTLPGQTPDGKWSILSRDRNGEENPGLYLQPTDGGPLIPIQHKAKVQTLFQFTSSDSKYVYYMANDIKPASYSLYRFDIATKKSELLYSPEGVWSVSDFKDDGRILLTKAVTNTVTEVYEFNVQTKELKPVIGQGEQEEYDVRYSAKAGEYLVLTPKLGEFRRLYVMRNKDLKPITPEIKSDVSTYSIDLKRTHIVYTVNEAGYSRGHAMDARTFKPLDFPKFPEADQTFIGLLTRDGQSAMIGVETAKGPRISYSYNFRTKALTRWVLPSQPEVNTEKFIRAKLEYYKTRDDVQIPMFVRRPPQCEDKNRTAPCPVVVNFHGGPEGQSTPGFSIYAQMFVDEGIIYVAPNVRGSDGYGKTWFHSDDGPKRLAVITDIEDASIFIKKNWAIAGQAPKVGVTGGSYGGYSTLVAMTMFAGAYDAGVSIVGMSNLVSFLNNTAPYRRALRTPEYGDPEKDLEALKKLSPVTYLDKVKSPLMIIQGANDPRVPVGEALQIHQLLESKKIPSSLIIFADEGHGSDKRPNKVLEIGHTIDFLKRNLQ